MKHLLIVFFLLFSVTKTFAQNHLDLTPEQEKSILDNLNDLCGDTWCEGEYDLQFKAVEHRNTGADYYAVQFTANGGYGPKPEKLTLVCEIYDLNVVQDLFRSDVGNSETRFYGEIDSCIQEQLYPGP